MYIHISYPRQLIYTYKNHLFQSFELAFLLFLTPENCDCNTLKSSTEHSMNARDKAAPNTSSSHHHYDTNFQTDVVGFLPIANTISPQSIIRRPPTHRDPLGPVPIHRVSQTADCQTSQLSSQSLSCTHFHCGVALNQSKRKAAQSPKRAHYIHPSL